MSTKSSPSGTTSCWRLFRHCCCRNGWYPLLVVPIVTLACWLSLYSTVGCNFMEIDIGFAPMNTAWSEPTGNIGLFYYHQPDFVHGNKYRNTFHTGCKLHSDEFESTYIDTDRTFKMARVMGMISCASSILAMVAAIMFVVTPLSTSYCWAGMLLPAVMTSFIAEGSKFLLFDTALCRSPLWLRGGSFLTPETAESCDMGNTAYYSIAAGFAQFVALCSVCLFAPHQRDLDPDYGMEDTDKEMEDTNVNEDHDDELGRITLYDEPIDRVESNVVEEFEEEPDEKGTESLVVGGGATNNRALVQQDIGGLTPIDCVAETIQMANDLVCSPTNTEIEDEVPTFNSSS